MSAPPIREAATVVMLRDGLQGLELFMVQRARKMAFSAGAYVFPGGAVDAQDGSQELVARCQGPADAVLDARLQISGARRFYVAALREAFEETGYLLARDARGQQPVWQPAQRSAFAAERRQLHAGSAGFGAWLQGQDLWLDCAAMHYYAFWTTPPGETRRFATRFFAAAAPTEQAPLHDGEETVDHCWIRPAAALAEYQAGRFKLIFPTIKQLEYFSGFSSVAQALAAMDALTDIPDVRPRLRFSPEGRFAGVALPGEAGYEELPAWD